MADAQPKYHPDIQKQAYDNSVDPVRQRQQLYLWDTNAAAPVRVTGSTNGELATNIQSTYDGTNFVSPRIDSSTYALETISYEHHEVHSGSHYNIQYSVADLGAATTPNDMMTLTFTTPDTTKWLHLVVAAVCSSGARFRFIEAGTGGGADPSGIVTAHNSNRNSDNTSTIINVAGTPAAGSVSYDATLVTGGTTLVDEFIGADGQGNSFVGGVARGEQEWVLKQNTQYQLSIFETGNVPGTLQMSWYEHTDKV